MKRKQMVRLCLAFVSWRRETVLALDGKYVKVALLLPMQGG